MVDLKKINIPSIPKVNLDTKKVMGAVDGLVDKIPPQVAALLKKIAISLLVFFILMGIYTGWSKGWESATPEGLQLASDTRSLFATDIEREYNRSRKDVKMSDPDDVKYESNHRMQFEFVSERERGNPEDRPAPEVDDFLGKEYDFRNRKNEASGTPPLATPSGDGLISSPINIEAIGAWENSNDLQEIGSVKELERKDVSLSPKTNNAIPSMKPGVADIETEEDVRFRKTLERLDKLEKLSAEKKRKEAELKKLSTETTAPQRKLRELEPLRK
jgi:hypothetical protein